MQSEVMAITGLTMTAAAAYYTASGQWSQTVIWLWALSAAYFASSVFYVKLRVTWLPRQKCRSQETRLLATRRLSFLSILLARGAGGHAQFASVCVDRVCAGAGAYLAQPDQT
ncbi:MAG: hypothetical protein ABI882_23340 [Acidobacteriota bacterium]